MTVAHYSQVLKKTTLENADDTPPHVQLLWFLVSASSSRLLPFRFFPIRASDTDLLLLRPSKNKWDPTGKYFDDARPLLEKASASYVVRHFE